VVNSIVLICEDSPFGKNSAVESIRMATGILAVGDIDDCKIILLNDAVYFLSKNINPEALNVDPFDNISSWTKTIVGNTLGYVRDIEVGDLDNDGYDNEIVLCEVVTTDAKLYVVNESGAIFPTINITSPINNSNLSSAAFDLNYTFVEANPGFCWYSNNSIRAKSGEMSFNESLVSIPNMDLISLIIVFLLSSINSSYPSVSL